MERARTVIDRVESGLKRLIPLLLLIFYSFFGAFLFHLIEDSAELDRRETEAADRDIQRLKTEQQLAYIYSNTQYSSAQMLNETVAQLAHFEKAIGCEIDDGDTKWGFWAAMFYSMTLYTTIGYGYQYPITTRGKIATCCYSIVGIPLALITLIQLGYLFACLCKAIWTFLTWVARRCSRGRKWTAVKTAEEGEDHEIPETDPLLSFPLAALIFMTVGWLLASAGIFLIWEEKWSYGDSLYFTFISFTTIGLGDTTPTHYQELLFCAIFILIGLALVSTCVTVLQMKMEAVVKKIQETIDEKYSEAEVPGVKERPGIDGILDRLPPNNKVLFSFLPTAQKERLVKIEEKRAKMESKGCQTEVALMQSYRLGLIGEEKRSHDDINSLVMACELDYKQ